MGVIKQNSTYNRTFLMVLSSDHETGATGKTVSVQLSKAGGAFAAVAGTVTEIGNGRYYVALTNVDTSTLGDLDGYCTASGCDATDWSDQVVAYDPFSAPLPPGQSPGGGPSAPPAEDLEELIETVAAGPRSVASDAGTAVAQPLPDLIQADRYLAAKTGRGTKRRGAMFTKLIPAGAMPDSQGTGAGGAAFDQPAGGF